MLNLNKVTLAGNVGNDPEVRTMQSGDKVCNFSLATKESWKDKATGDWKEATEWHRIVVFNAASIKFIENNVKKGSQLYVEGQVETRNYDKDGQKVYTTEIVVRPYSGGVQLIDKFDSASQGQSAGTATRQEDVLEDEIPFEGNRRADHGPAPTR